MAVRPGSHVWERTDNDGWCDIEYGSSSDGIYRDVGRGHEVLSIMETDLEQGAGFWIEEGEQKFQVEHVICDPDNLDKPIRVISHERPPFGEWRIVG
ncbi:hypothetical protein [Nocardia alni]|uniref:hypothetical protein n=1 Tax=Nocardia alni TaxID=2815723 RepID=UPI001C241B67|nr:hypothetical protein [Nocardia alni]